MNFGIWIAADPGAEKINPEKVHLLRTDRNLEYIILAPGHSHSSVAEERYPLMSFTEIKVVMMWRVICADERMRKYASQHISQLLLRLDPIMMPIKLGPVEQSRIAGGELFASIESDIAPVSCPIENVFWSRPSGLQPAVEIF